MSFTPFICTLASNVDEKGEIINENIVGTAIQLDILQQIFANQETGEQRFETIPRVAVLWDHERTPSPAFHPANDLYWLDDEEVDDPEFVSPSPDEFEGEANA